MDKSGKTRLRYSDDLKANELRIVANRGAEIGRDREQLSALRHKLAMGLNRPGRGSDTSRFVIASQAWSPQMGRPRLKGLSGHCPK